MSHTPGPWMWNGEYPIRIISAEMYYVCGDMAPSQKDDARLIAAAPDLLKAVQAVQKWLAATSDDDLAYAPLDKERARLAKAWMRAALHHYLDVNA